MCVLDVLRRALLAIMDISDDVLGEERCKPCISSWIVRQFSCDSCEQCRHAVVGLLLAYIAHLLEKHAHSALVLYS